MGSLYLPGTIDMSRREIARFENGYVKDAYGNYIGKYDDKTIYDGTNVFSNNVGSIEFNYGYLSGSSQIFVTAYSDYLSVDGDRYSAYFDGYDQKGAIAAYILCYLRGEIPNNNNTGSTITNDSSSSSGGYSGTSGGYAGGNGEGCCLESFLGIIAIIAFIVICCYASFSATIGMIKGILTGESISNYWTAVGPFVALLLGGVVITQSKEKLSVKEVASKYLIFFIVINAIISMGCTVFEGFLAIFVVMFGLAVISLPMWVIGSVIVYVILKNKNSD